MRLSVIVTLALAFGCLVAGQSELEDSYTIDAALTALVDLRDDTSQSLYDLEESWRLSSGALSEQISDLQDIITAKDAECAQDEADTAATQAELTELQAYVDWLEKQIKDTTDNLNDLLKRRCDVNKAFIDHLRREKVALSLLEFIKTAISNKDSFDFIQMKTFNRKFHTFIQAYRKNDFESILLLQQDLIDSSQYDIDVDYSTHDRTDDEIGTGHIDNKKGDLDLEDFTNGKRKNWSIYKAELLQILSDLQAKIQANIKQSIDDEIAASVALANYKNNALRDIKKYNKDLVKAKQSVIDLTAKFNADTAKATQCRSEEDLQKAQLGNLQNDFNEKEATYHKKHDDLQSQIDIFNEVIQIYQTSIFSEGDDFKERTDDYLDNSTFDDDSTYTNREIPNIDFINPEGNQAQSG